MDRTKLRLEDTNMALVGSEVEQKVKAAAAEGEVAWKDVGQTAGVNVWRIEQFRVVGVAEGLEGTFYDGDSYIVLHTQELASGQLRWDIYFWLGTYTTQDEAGTAAYKTVELDDFLGGAAVQHREVQGHESAAFGALFPTGLRILPGGVSSGFHHVAADDADGFVVQLYHVSGKRMRDVKAIPVVPTAASLSEGDVYVMRCGRAIYVFQGNAASPGERMKASELATKLADAVPRGGGRVEVVTSDDAPEDFWAHLGGRPDGALPDERAVPEVTSALYKLSDASGDVLFEKLGDDGAGVDVGLITPDDVFVVDAVHEVCVVVGSSASRTERIEAMPRAQAYLNQGGPSRSDIPIVRVIEGGLAYAAYMATLG